MKKPMKIVLGLFATILVVGGVGTGVYFGFIKKNDPIQNSTPKKLNRNELEVGFLTYSIDDLIEFTHYLNLDKGSNIQVNQDEDKKEDIINKIFNFYKSQNNLNWDEEERIISKFKEIYPLRKTFLEKQLDDSVRSTLENSFSSLEMLKSFANKEDITFLNNDTQEEIIQKILDAWLDTFISKTQTYLVWENFQEKNFWSYAKQLKNQLTTLDDIKSLSAQELYQLHYDSLTEFFKDKITLFTTLNSLENERLKLFFAWLNDKKDSNLQIGLEKDTMIQSYIDYYKRTKLVLANVNNQLDDFNSFYNLRQIYLSKELTNDLKSELEAKFDSINKIIAFKIAEGVTTLASDSLADIIVKIIAKWNENLHEMNNTVPLWKNFAENQELLNIALNNNDQLNTLDDIKNLKSSTTLYQLHYDAWNNYYRKKITNYVIPISSPSTFDKTDYLTLPSDVQNTIKNKIYQKYGFQLSNIQNYIDFINYVSKGTNKAYTDVDAVELKENYGALGLIEMQKLVFDFLFKNYEQYTKEANNNLIDGVGVYKLFDENHPTYKVFGLINYVTLNINDLKLLEKTNPLEFFKIYRQAWIDKINHDIDNFPELPMNKVVVANSLMQKDDPQRRNGYGFSCDFTASLVPDNQLLMNRNSWSNPYLDKKDKADEIIVCALLDSAPSATPSMDALNNNFPLIIFDKINNDLVNKGLDPTAGMKDTAKILQTKLDTEAKARKAAKVISDNLLSSLSFAGELVNLDAIIFHRYRPRFGASGVYTEVYKDVSLQPWWSNRLLNLYIIPKLTGKSDLSSSPGYVPFGKDELKDISFDLYETYKTLAHEYGHHVTLHNGLFDSQIFLDELKKVFYDNGNNQAFNDFVKMYKYFNSMNEDNSLNFVKVNGVLELNVGAINTLKLWRKYYAHDVRSVYDLIYKNLFKGFTKQKVLENIIASLNFWKARGIVNPTLFNYINEINSGNETNKDQLKKYYLYYYNPNAVNKPPTNDEGTWLYYSQILFWYVSDSYDLDDDRSTQLTVGDIFPNMKVVDWKTNQEIANTYCLDQGYNFHGGTHSYEMIQLYKTAFTTEKLFKIQSAVADKATLSDLQYYFSTNELLARMYAVLTYKYPDKRSYINKCSLNSQSIHLDTRDLFLENGNFEDYGFFRSFGMNLLKGDNERILYKMLTHKQDIDDNQGKVYKNNIKKQDNSNPNLLEDEVPYSLSSKIVVNKDGEKLNGFAKVHLIVDLKLDNPEDAFLIKLQYGNDDPITPFFYDYSNSQVVVNDVDDNIENADNLHLTPFYSSPSEAKKHVSLVFPLFDIKGELFDDGSYRFYSSIKGRQISYDVLKDSFKWNSEDEKPILFIDKNYNNTFDNEDILIPFN